MDSFWLNTFITLHEVRKVEVTDIFFFGAMSTSCVFRTWTCMRIECMSLCQDVDVYAYRVMYQFTGKEAWILESDQRERESEWVGGWEVV